MSVFCRTRSKAHRLSLWTLVAAAGLSGWWAAGVAEVYGQDFVEVLEDIDGDGVPDKYDLCPNIPEDMDGFQDIDGCPDPDNDGDGILDAFDDCPEQKELVNGYRGGDGCPDGNQWARPAKPVIAFRLLSDDFDGDGISDAEDLCPDAAEDFDGFQDTDGCPEFDNDGDNIPDIIDLCPQVPERVNGVQDEDGCPEIEVDQDKDGVPDFRDVCPLEPETKNGIRDEDGCPEGAGALLVLTPLHPEEKSRVLPNLATPEQRAGAVQLALVANPDLESDGIPEDQDLCPDAVEDFDGFQDGDGCPDLDNDGDGILDVDDDCPNSAEVVNGFWDDDGCPDSADESLAKLSGVIEGLHFLQGSEVIQKRSLRVLREAVEVLRSNPVLTLEITGHTDNEGDREDNILLSLRRAEAVKSRFIAYGIEASRITAIGKGPIKPRASNGTADGRAKNRRVEFEFGMGDNGTSP